MLSLTKLRLTEIWKGLIKNSENQDNITVTLTSVQHFLARILTKKRIGVCHGCTKFEIAVDQRRPETFDFTEIEEITSKYRCRPN